jgi:hypothetical protein
LCLVACSSSWDDDTALDDDTVSDDDDADDDAADDDSHTGDDDTAGGDGPYEVIVDHGLTLDDNPLALSRLDATTGTDGRVYFTGYDGWGQVYICSFDGAYEGHIVQQDRGIDLACESFPVSSVYFFPRIALDDANEPAVVWDLTSCMETRGRYQGQEQALFVADTTSVNHPDITFAGGAFTAVSQWFQAIGRMTFEGLPTSAPIEGDWDLGQGTSEKKGPSIAANERQGIVRAAWSAYYGSEIYMKTVATGDATVTDLEFTAHDIHYDGLDRQGYPGWSHVAVDSQLDIHIVWNDWIDDGSVLGQHRGLEYRHITHPDLQTAADLFVDLPLGDATSFSPVVAVNDSLDVVVAFASNLDNGSDVFLLLRDAGASAFTAVPHSLESGRTGSPYNPAATAFGHTFWVLYNSLDGDQVRVVRLGRGEG